MRLVVFGLILVCGCAPRSSTTVVASKPADTVLPAGTIFEDVTASSGVSSQYRNGEEVQPPHLSILESLGGGLGVIDFDGDGLLDIYFAGGGHFGGDKNHDILGHPGKLYRNLGNFQFEDVTAQVGLATLADGKPWFYSHAVAVCDYDCDGWPDLLVTGWGRVALFHNEPNPKGGRQFRDMTASSGLGTGITWTTSAAWADFDGDGLPDLYLCQYVDWSFANHPDCNYDGKTPDVCPPKRFKGLRHLVFRNLGNGTFANVTETSGIVPGGDGASKGLGVVAIDVNADGKPDLYVANDTVPNFLYLNKSTKGSILFEEMGLKAGVAVDGFSNPNGSMGTDAGDPERTGKPTIFCTNYENELHALYRNVSTPERPFFLYVTPASGMAALGQKFVGWGTGFVDLDRDGWEDVMIANGHAIRSPTTTTRKQKPVFLRNAGQGKFVIESNRGGSYFQSEHLSRGLVFADFNNDGQIDVAIANMNEPAAILKNVSPDGNHWLGVTVKGLNNHDVVGARVTVKTGDVTQTRFAKGGGSYASSPDRRLFFGLGSASTGLVMTIVWPDGKKREYRDVAVDRYVIAKYDDETLQPVK